MTKAAARPVVLCAIDEEASTKGAARERRGDKYTRTCLGWSHDFGHWRVASGKDVDHADSEEGKGRGHENGRERRDTGGYRNYCFSSLSSG